MSVVARWKCAVGGEVKMPGKLFNVEPYRARLQPTKTLVGYPSIPHPRPSRARGDGGGPSARGLDMQLDVLTVSVPAPPRP
jgi:hypothetical protein